MKGNESAEVASESGNKSLDAAGILFAPAIPNELNASVLRNAARQGGRGQTH
jgi:hypothetical protein